MGFFRDLFFGKQEEKEQEVIETQKEEEQKAIEKQKEELDGSIILELDKMEQRALAIVIVNEKKGMELSEKIDEFREKIKQTNYDENTLQDEFSIFKTQFEQELKILGEQYLFQELEILIRKLNARIFGDETEENEEKESIDYLEKKLEILSKKKDTFSSERRNLYIRQLIYAEYRLECYKLIQVQWDHGNYYLHKKVNKIKDASREERDIYATILKDDAISLYDYVKKIRGKYRLEGEKCKELPSLETKIEELIRTMDVKYPEVMGFSNIFKDEEFMESYLSIISSIRQLNSGAEKTIKTIKMQKQKKQEEQRAIEEEERKRQELEEKIAEQKKHYKELSEEEMKIMIEQLDDEVFDITKSYINILAYEIEVAEAKGILTAKDKFEVTDMERRRVSADELTLAIQRANGLGINYSAILGIDDNEKNNMLFFPKGNQNKLLSKRENKRPNFSYKKVNGNYGDSFIEYYMQKSDEHIAYVDERLCFDENGSEGKKRFLEIYEELEKMKTEPRQVQGVKVGLQMSYLRPIIPILEKLREAGIDYYLPPIDDEMTRKKPTKEIYIDRKDLEKYKKLIHPNISTQELGEIGIISEDVDLYKMILGDTKIEFIEHEREEKAKQEKVKNISEQDLRDEIKRIDDESYDVTKSYREILEYEKTVARAKGLLNKKSEMSADDLGIIRIARRKLGSYMREAEKKEIAYTVLYDVDDNPKQDCLIIVSKSNMKKVGNRQPQYYSRYDYCMLKGKYGESFIQFFQDCVQDDELFFSNTGIVYTQNGYDYEKKEGKKQLEQCAEKIKELDNKDYIENVKCYIEVPYLRPIIPILEVLQKENIEYYIPPIDEEFNKSRPTARIYIDRENMTKYREKVHPQISGAEQGIVSVFGENLTFSQIMLEGTESPYIKDKEEIKR